MGEFSAHIASQFREKAKELRQYARGQSRHRTAILGYAKNFEALADRYEERLRAKAPCSRRRSTSIEPEPGTSRSTAA
jgi:hypothetical protein